MTRSRRLRLTAAGCGLAFTALAAWSAVTHWLAWRFGMGDWPVPPGTPWTYQLESGFIPALTVLTLLGTVVSLYHLHNCHKDGCWRLGKHKINGTPWCSLHEEDGRHYHGDDARLAELLEAQHETNQLLGEILQVLRSR